MISIKFTPTINCYNKWGFLTCQEITNVKLSNLNNKSMMVWQKNFSQKWICTFVFWVILMLIQKEPTFLDFVGCSKIIWFFLLVEGLEYVFCKYHCKGLLLTGSQSGN